ncbi:MAG: addiction module toxin RelE [Bacteroidetes bacterium GWA2_31_9]|nr:MAG: addiction module toxin RelE [Bacteroidetes bacterium GWA2_31_9]
MANKVTPTPYFENKYKKLSKKFPSLGSELLNLENELKENPTLGESLGANIYKVRIASKDKGKGKSGGFRIITYLVHEVKNSIEIFLITIYDKSEESSISISSLKKIVKMIFGY